MLSLISDGSAPEHEIQRGHAARPTANPTHVWLALYMQDCASAPPERSQWHLFTPPGRAEQVDPDIPDKRGALIEGKAMF